MRWFWSADDLDFTGSLWRCIPGHSQRGFRLGLFPAPREHPGCEPQTLSRSWDLLWAESGDRAAAPLSFLGICCSGSEDFLLAITNELAFMLVSK